MDFTQKGPGPGDGSPQQGERSAHNSRCACESALDLERAAEGGKEDYHKHTPGARSFRRTEHFHLGKAAAGVMYFFKKKSFKLQDFKKGRKRGRGRFRSSLEEERQE